MGVRRPGHGDPIAAHCSTPETTAAPVYRFLRGEGGFIGGPSAPSLGQMVTLRIEALDVGALRYDRDVMVWRQDIRHIPPALRATQLM
jgi:hypothetical protein